MHKKLRPEQVDILVGSSPVNTEFSTKVRELDRRLHANGMSYRDWESLNDRQHDIFTDNLFLDGQCASSVDHYVKGAVASCGCPDTEEELHHHSPVLMGEIEKQEDMLPDITMKIGEGLDNLNGLIDLVLEQMLSEEETEDQRYASVNEAVKEILAAANPEVTTNGKDGGGAPPQKKSKGGYSDAKTWQYTNTLGPQSARLELVNKVKAKLAEMGATQFKDYADNFRGFRAIWPDGFNYGLKIFRGGAKGIGNKGDILEGLLACAFYLRFQDPEGEVSVKDIFTTARSLAANATETASGKGKNGTLGPVPSGKDNQDNITLKVGLAKGAFTDLTAEKEHPNDKGEKEGVWDDDLRPLAAGAAKAVSYKTVKDLAKTLWDSQTDTIGVSAMGLVGQLTTKADLQVTIDGRPDLELGTNAFKILKTIGHLSLKYNSTLLGQTGKSWDGPKGIRPMIKDMFMVDVGDQSAAWKEVLKTHAGTENGNDEIKKALSDMVMGPVAEKLGSLFNPPGKDAEAEATAKKNLLKAIENGVRKAGTGYTAEEVADTKNNPPMGFLSIGDETADYLDFYVPLTTAMEDTADLAVVHRKDEGENPMLLFYDKNKLTNDDDPNSTPYPEPKSKSSPNVLFSYRGKPENKGKTFRTYIEYGPRLKELTQVAGEDAQTQIQKDAADAVSPAGAGDAPDVSPAQ
jgi:hypothetical protein